MTRIAPLLSSHRANLPRFGGVFYANEKQANLSMKPEDGSREYSEAFAKYWRQYFPAKIPDKDIVILLLKPDSKSLYKSMALVNDKQGKHCDWYWMTIINPIDGPLLVERLFDAFNPKDPHGGWFLKVCHKFNPVIGLEKLLHQWRALFTWNSELGCRDYYPSQN